MSSTDNIIILRSSDGESFEVKEAVVRRSPTISHLIDGGIPDDGIHLPKVTGKILSMVIEYCKKHVCDIDRDYSVTGDDLEAWDAEVDRDDFLDFIWGVVDRDNLEAWDAEFVEVDQATLFDLIKAAHYLKIKSLLDLAFQTVDDNIKSLPPEEIRKTFNIRNEFTPEEEEEVRRETTRWNFE